MCPKINSSVISKGAMNKLREMFPLARMFPLAVMHTTPPPPPLSPPTCMPAKADSQCVLD